MNIYTLSELESLPTLATGQADDLKVDTGTKRVWLSRCTVEDGEPYDNKVTFEELQEGRWVIIKQISATIKHYELHKELELLTKTWGAD